MMHVHCQPEPDNFNDMVRKKGEQFLKTTPKPTMSQWKTHAYWAGVNKELHGAYNGICNFSCHWIPFDTGSITVEHFKPKSKHPDQAYEWSNFRLMCGTLNGRKGSAEDILDPFELTTGTFVIDFPSLLIKPAKELVKATDELAWSTIRRLGLNDEGTCLKGRERYIKKYCLKEVDFAFLESDAPFIAHELKRQELTEKIRSIMVY